MELKNTIYHTTALEDWVTNLYTRLRILQPRHIKEKYIAQKFEIFILKNPIPSTFLVRGRFQGIYLDTRVSKEEQKEHFFHELCHILRHVGCQSMMPKTFQELQEWDARNFVRYAAIPHHMINYIDFKDEYVVENTANLFKITPELAEERLNQIKHKINDRKYLPL
jgi:Zn-dependent peptidase ImmA (M78 family)